MRIIDASSIRRLGNEFLDISDQIRDFTGRFAGRQHGPGVFGSLTESTHAAGEYDAVTRTALDCLEQLQNTYQTFAEHLGLAARHYEIVEDENINDVSSLGR